MNRLWNTLLGDVYGCALPTVGGTGYEPAVDVTETKDAYTLLMDIPGKTEKDVEINLKDSVLTIMSVKAAQPAEKAEEEKRLLQERVHAEFKRSFALPKDVDAEQVSAVCKNGVLTVVMPRKAELAVKKIAINAA